LVVADDNADMRHYLVRLLAERYDVQAVSDGEAALAAARERLPDLIVSDVMMPKLDGISLLRELRTDPALKEVPTILLSARAGEESRLEGVESGADDYLIKPFSTRELLARVESQVKMHRMRQEARVKLEEQVRLRTHQLEQRTTELVKQSEELRNLSARLLQIQDAERRRIARDLHDSAGQTLVALGMTLTQLIRKMKNIAPDAAKLAREIQELVRQLSDEIRTASYLLHPPLLEEGGLAAALRCYIDGLRQRSHLDITLHISEQFERFPEEIELPLFRIVQECITNILRHSGSKTAVIRLVHDLNAITLEVQDQGSGMPIEKLSEIQSRGSGVGIRGMRERVRQFGGTVTIESSAAGTRVLVSIPSVGLSVTEQNGLKRSGVPV
jgi:signal transduction histidine kinase